jgi:NADH dehydrogenase
VGFKTLPEAIELRNRLLRSFENAETIEDPAERTAYLTFVFVGAGYAGLEGLAELQDFAADVIDLYPRCRTQGMRWILVEARERVMTEIEAPLAQFAAGELRSRGIEIRTSTTLDEVGESFVRLSDGEVVPTRMLCWTAGVRPHPVVAELGLPLDANGRIEVDRAMHVKGVDGVWAIGDAAAVPDPAQGNVVSSPPTGQHAIRQGRTAGRNVATILAGGKARPFTYKTRGVFVDMGEHKAVASTLGIRWKGSLAWLLARTYHLAMMPGTKRKLRLLADWNVQLLFGRDGAELGGLGNAPPLDQHLSAGATGDAPTIRRD